MLRTSQIQHAIQGTDNDWRHRPERDGLLVLDHGPEERERGGLAEVWRSGWLRALLRHVGLAALDPLHCRQLALDVGGDRLGGQEAADPRRASCQVAVLVA